MAEADVERVLRLHDLLERLPVLFAEIALQERVLFLKLLRIVVNFDILG